MNKITMPNAVFSYGNIKVQLDTTNLNEMLYKKNKAILKASENDEIMMDMAEHVIYSASEADLIPYKKLYQIRSTKGRRMVDENGRFVRYKRGNRKGEIRREPFTPAQYYHYKTTGIGNALIHNDTSSKWQEDFVSSDITVGGKHRYKGVLTKTKEQTIHKNRGQDVITRGTGEETYGAKVKQRRKRVYWKDVGTGNPVYNRSYTEILQKSKKGTSSRKKYYSDRPPHLSDIGDPRGGMSSHVVTVKNHRAYIRIQAKKPKDKRFMDEGGEQYAYIQYNTPDKNWHRISTYTENGAIANTSASGRWLELAIGLPIPSGYKKKSIGSVGKENYKDMVDLLRTELRRKLEETK